MGEAAVHKWSSSYSQQPGQSQVELGKKCRMKKSTCGSRLESSKNFGLGMPQVGSTKTSADRGAWITHIRDCCYMCLLERV